MNSQHQAGPLIDFDGVGQPTGPQTAQGGQNPYHVPNAALGQVNGRITGETQMKLAQAEQAGAMAGKAQAEAEIMRGLQQQQSAQQAEQLAIGIVQGEVDPKAVMAGAQQGDPIAAQALQMAEAMVATQQQAQSSAHQTGPFINFDGTQAAAPAQNMTQSPGLGTI